MKNFIISATVLLSLSNLASAGPLVCKSSKQASGQGMEVTISSSGNNANLVMANKKAITLVFSPMGGNRPVNGSVSQAMFVQPSQANGYFIVLTQKHLGHDNSVEVFQGGFTGPTSQGVLDDCK